MPETTASSTGLDTTTIFNKEEVLSDYRLATESREVSYLGRKDVFSGRAKFGIFGDGKELAQIALSKVFRKGDYRSGYYRDQTLVAALGGLSWRELFSQLYAHADLQFDPFSGGRSMNAHYGNAWVDENGQWIKLTEEYNHVMDVSSTAGQIPRSLGLAYASKLYRLNKELASLSNFSKNGNEVCFATIGDASTSQGMFLEAINAAGVLQIPVIFSVWDDGYGISVPSEFQTTKSSISKALEGFQRNDDGEGLEIIVARGWNYPELIKAYEKAARFARDRHIPCLVHIIEMTQPQGHSASGSHERYKNKERLQWEDKNDCKRKLRECIISQEIATDAELKIIDEHSKEVAKNARQEAWSAARAIIDEEIKKVKVLLEKLSTKARNKAAILQIKKQLVENTKPLLKDAFILVKKLQRATLKEEQDIKLEVEKLLKYLELQGSKKYNTHLYSEFESSPLNVEEIKPVYDNEAPLKSGHQIINQFFDETFQNNPLVFALGEDVGQIGDVNQGFAGLQEKYGKLRIEDTGIRETTIIGQGIGAAMRGLRPIVEVQYFDYIYYCLSVLTDDLACLRYRTMGRQLAPLIVRTRGHRLEGIWHSGSPMAVMIHALRGMHILVPRNFVQAAGMYNTLLKGDDPALVIEPLNAYRLKELLPENLGQICIPLGKPEILKEGKDLTIVTYGSMCQFVMEAAKELEQIGILAEVIDAQTLLPFDLHGVILASLKKTNRIIFADEDMPGGATAYMMREIIDHQQGYHFLDSAPVCVSAKPNRPPYGNDGDYFTKPNVEDIYDAAYKIISEANPTDFPAY